MDTVFQGKINLGEILKFVESKRKQQKLERQTHTLLKRPSNKESAVLYTNRRDFSWNKSLVSYSKPSTLFIKCGNRAVFTQLYTKLLKNKTEENKNILPNKISLPCTRNNYEAKGCFNTKYQAELNMFKQKFEDIKTSRI